MTASYAGASIGLVALSFGLMLGLVGCSAAPYYRQPLDLRVQTTDTTNRDMPVAVEVVYVYDKALADTLSALTAQQWFRRRSALAWRHPRGFEYWRWEWTPGQAIPTRTLPEVFYTTDVFVYAGYQSAGAHRARVAPHHPIDIQLNRTGFQARVAP